MSNGGAGNQTGLQSSGKTAITPEGGAESGAPPKIDPNLGSLIDAWPSLPEPIRAGILAMVQAAGK